MLDVLLGVLAFIGAIAVMVLVPCLWYLLGWFVDRNDPNWRDRR